MIQSLRVLRRAPLIAASVVATLGLAIGVAATVFLVADAALFAPLPIADEDRVVAVVSSREDEGGHYSVALHNYLGWRDASTSFVALSAARGRAYEYESAGGRERLLGNEVTSEYPVVLGVEPRLGRWLRNDDEAGLEVVLGASLWRRAFAADEEIVGRSLRLDGELYRVVGVMPDAAPEPALDWGELWTRLEVDEAAARVKPVWGFHVLGRLRPGIEVDAALAELRQVAGALQTEYPAFNQGWTVELRPVRWWIERGARPTLLLLLAGGALVLLLACGNTANLMLALTLRRRRETAVRRALGANASQLAARIIGECLLLAGFGGVVGAGVALAAGRWLLPALPVGLPRHSAAGVDGRALAFVAGAALLSAFLVASLPVWRTLARVEVPGAARTATPSGAAVRSGAWLLSAQVGLAFAVLVVAALLSRSLDRLQAVSPGFVAQGLLTVEMDTNGALPEKVARIAAYRDLLRRVEALPGVKSAAMNGTRLPMQAGQGTFELFVEGQPRSTTPEIVATAQIVSPAFFDTLQIPFVAGGGFDRAATWELFHVVIVNQTFARRYLPAGGALGRWVEFANGERGTVVGVAGDVRQLGLARDPAAVLYLPWGVAPPRQTLVLRSERPALDLLPLVRAELETVAPGATIGAVTAGGDLVASSYARRTVARRLMTLLALFALGVGALGVYAVVAHQLSRRLKELAVRIACGASLGSLRRMLLQSALRPTLLGLVLGLGPGLAFARSARSVLFEISWIDPASLMIASATLLAVALLATAPSLLELRRLEVVDLLREE